MVQDVITNLKTEWHILVQDESIFVHDLRIRRKWIVRQKRPLVTVTGFHSKTIIFGVLYQVMINNYSHSIIDLTASPSLDTLKR
jgi:hypothetical protein